MAQRERGGGRIDPRVARTRRAVVEAVGAILAEEGAGAATHQRVAERAGVGRATLYRHWPTAADLLYDALREIDEPLLIRPRTGGLVEWLRRELRRAATDLGQPNAVQVQAVLIGRATLDPDADQLRRLLVKRNLDTLAEGIETAVARGELGAAPDPDDLLAELLGPVVFRVVFEGRAATREFLDGVIERALAPWTTPKSETT